MDKKYIFFLGGYDLEMVTIKEILEKRKEKFFDKKLSWGAKASSYQSELAILQPEQIPVLIELGIDIPIPPETIIIDHHNEKSGADKKASIEQVAGLLGIELTLEQKYVAVNDKKYIPGLISLQLSEKKIKEIRKKDRIAQGVTDKDEELGKTSVAHFLNKLDDDTVLIYSLTEKTSTITDSIYRYYRHIFIITPSKKISYSGTGELVKKLIQKYSELKNSDNEVSFWFGGNLPLTGYFGANKALTKNEIKELCYLMPEKRIYSQHLFLFPFTIKSEELKSLENPSSKNILQTIHKRLKESDWKYKPFQIAIDKSEPRITDYSEDEIWAYNEHNYFHEFIHKTLYTETLPDALFDEAKNQVQPVSLFYEMDSFPNDETTYYIKGDQPVHYTLKVDHASLRIFETGIGILSLTLYNTCYQDFDAILKINDYGRRIYPQFLGLPKEKETPIDETKKSFFPDKIIFNACGLKSEQEFKTEDFFNKPNAYAEYLQLLLEPLNSNKDGIVYKCKPVIDDRMFTICWHEHEPIINTLKVKKGESYTYEDSDDWYKYIYIDSGKYPLVQDINFKRELIKKSTYPRFTEWGTLFGITRYSFMCLCGIDTYNDFPYKIVRNHMQKMYFQMCVLLLAQRASIIQFNNELEEISLELRADDGNNPNNKNDKTDNRNQSTLRKLEKLEQLNTRVINFKNRLVFDEITPQEQGIELYKIALENMEIPQQIKSLKSRIAELHLTADQIYERINHDEEVEQSKVAKIITVIGAIFLPLTLFNTLWKFDFDLFLPLYWVDVKLLGGNYAFWTGLYKRVWFIALLVFLFVFTFTLVNNLTFKEEKEPGGKKIKFRPLNAIFSSFKIMKSDPLRKWKILLWSLLILIVILIVIPPFLKNI